jgi:hypothetical protein
MPLLIAGIVLRRSDTAALERVLAALEEGDDGEPASAALEDWGRLQMHATLARVRDESLTVRWLDQHGVSRQRLNQWRRGGRLVGIRDVPGVKGFVYPRWQFTDALRPKPWLAQVIEAAEEARLEPLAMHLFMTNPDAGYDRSPLEAAEAGDVHTTVELVAAANAQGG